MLIFFIWHIVPLFAFFHTFRCFAAFTFAWTTSTVHMMLAWLDFVRTTTLIRSIWTAGDNTFANPIAPRSAGKTTTQNTNSNHYFSAPGIKREQVEKKTQFQLPIATETACVATRYQIIGRNMDVFCTIAVNASLHEKHKHKKKVNSNEYFQYKEF